MPSGAASSENLSSEEFDQLAENLRQAARSGALQIPPGGQAGVTIRDPETGVILFPRPEHYQTGE
ncbi:MAG: hypothetical protein IT352_03935 [Gemmatimonadales bacterium]|nr:hypothetical protein [Gemmatimonadales bacterium]